MTFRLGRKGLQRTNTLAYFGSFVGHLNSEHNGEEDDEDEADGLQLQVVVRHLDCWAVLLLNILKC
jgi:hypothetical protein